MTQQLSTMRDFARALAVADIHETTHWGQIIRVGAESVMRYDGALCRQWFTRVYERSVELAEARLDPGARYQVLLTYENFARTAVFGWFHSPELDHDEATYFNGGIEAFRDMEWDIEREVFVLARGIVPEPSKVVGMKLGETT